MTLLAFGVTLYVTLRLSPSRVGGWGEGQKNRPTGLLVIPLGELGPGEVERALARYFGALAGQAAAGRPEVRPSSIPSTASSPSGDRGHAYRHTPAERDRPPTPTPTPPPTPTPTRDPRAALSEAVNDRRAERSITLPETPPAERSVTARGGHDELRVPVGGVGSRPAPPPLIHRRAAPTATPSREPNGAERACEPEDAFDWLDRGALRRRPLATLLRARRRRYADAVLVAGDLDQRRLRLTSAVLALPDAQRKWRIDLRGRREAFSFRAHVADNAVPIARHLAACALAWLLAKPALRAFQALIANRDFHLRGRGLRASPPAGGPPGAAACADQSSVGGPSGAGACADQSSAAALWFNRAEKPDENPSERHARRPPRILYLRSQFWLGLAGGGSVAHTAGVIGGLAQAGAEVEVVSSDHLPGVNVPAKVVTPETWFDGALREVEEVGYTLPFALAAWRVGRRMRPDAIYQRHTAFNCAGAILSRLLRRPLVLEFNSSELWKGRYWGGLHWRAMAELVEGINLAAAHRVVVVSDVLRRRLLADGLPDARIVVNPNAVDPDVFGPHVDGSVVRQRLGLDRSSPAVSDAGTAADPATTVAGRTEGVTMPKAARPALHGTRPEPAATTCITQVVVGFSGTFGLWHGVPTLAAALPLVLVARPNVRWLLIGDGPLRGLVDQAIAGQALAERVSLPGLVPHAEMPAYLAACDILVAPHGRQADGGEFFGSPTKLFEYLAVGRAIVASAVGQIADVLEHERTALLIPPDDPAALCAAIVRLVDDGALRQRLARNARAVATARHTWRQNAERLLASLA